ncbi:MAG: SMP-30/gluconolactonase/LRE family protein [Nocardioidaceae bacterium]
MTKPTLSPRRWTPPPAVPGSPSTCADVRVIATPGYGPEDVLVLPDGRVLTGLFDGRVVAIDPATERHTVVCDTGGRPLGLELHPDGGVVVCDAYRGVLRLDVDDGTTTELVTSVDGRAMMFCNNAAVARDGTIYFTDSSTKFGFEHWRGDLLEHGASGRLFRRSPDGAVDQLADGLAFANGVALAADESYVVVAETAGYALRRYQLAGPDQGALVAFGDVLPGFPDNISTGTDGLIWVAIASPRDKSLDLLLPRVPFLRTIVWALPQTICSRSPSASSARRRTTRRAGSCTTSRPPTPTSASRPVCVRSTATCGWAASRNPRSPA